jgi:hypothetical protein
MRVLVIADKAGDRLCIRQYLRELPFSAADKTHNLVISEESPSQGSMLFVLSGHPKGSFYDLIIAANEIKQGTGLEMN